MKRVCVFLITAALVAGMAGSIGCVVVRFPDVPPSQNLEIQTWYDLDAVRDNLAGNHTLMNDLDSTTAGYQELASPTASGGKGWQPIATYIPEWGFMGFMGTFDGQGHEIRDLFINRSDEDFVGLFHLLELAEPYGIYGEGVIKDIGVVNATVTGKDRVGGLVGHNAGTVSNSYFTGNVTGYQYVGGLVGLNHGTVSSSYFTGALTGDRWVGGLVGLNKETVSNSYSSGSVTGNNSVGGLVGWNNDFTTLSDSHSSSIVTGVEIVGGLVGDNGYAGTVNDCYFTGSVAGEGDVGGLVGVPAYGTVSNSYYNYDEVLINGARIITIGALFGEDFDQWLANDKFLDVNDRLSQESGYYAVNNVTDFKELLAFGQDGSLKFRLKNDLDLATEPNFYIPYLAGEFDGNGHKISNLSFNFDFVSPVGLFGYLAPDGKVTNVGVENTNITGYTAVGGLVGYTWEGTVSNSYFTGSVSGTTGVGGLVGCSNFGIVDSSYSSGSVTGFEHVGGLVGFSGTVSNSYSSANVTGEYSIGGLVGSNGHDPVSNSYSTGSVTGTAGVGGLVGMNFGTASVSSSYSTGNVTGDEYVGGLVGFNSDRGTVSNSFWDTETSGQSTSDGGTGKTTAEMQDIVTFSGAGWNIVAVALNETNPAYIWNIVNTVTYPFLSWQPV